MKPMTLATYLKEGRIRTGLTKTEVADRLFLTSTWPISQWEHGRYATLPLLTLKQLVVLYSLDHQVVLDLLLIHQFSKLEKKVKKLIEKGS